MMSRVGFLGAVLLFGAGCRDVVRFDTEYPDEEPITELPVVPANQPGRFVDARLIGLSMTGSQIDLLGTIEFKTARWRVEDYERNVALLNTIAVAGKQYAQITRLRVEGHTDSDGDDASNLLLSQRRAEAVVEWLVANGIDRNRLVAAGCGEKDPLAPNDSANNKQANRRVEFDIEEMEGKRYEVATDPCAPNTYRKGYVTLNAPGWSGSDVTFEVDKPQYNYLETAKIRYSRPLDVPEGQQYWLTINRAGDPDTNNGAWHFVKKGALVDTMEIFKSDGKEAEWEIRLHDIYPKYPQRVIHRQKIRVVSKGDEPKPAAKPADDKSGKASGGADASGSVEVKIGQ
jgi:OOP family OmpA-OmpF porin